MANRQSRNVRRPDGVTPLAVVAIVGLMFGIAVASAALTFVVLRRGPEPGPTTELAPTPNVLVAVQDLSRLEGASFHMQRVIDLKEKQSTLFGVVQAEDAILLVAAADVVAGVDLSLLREDDVTVSSDGKSVRIALPPAMVFSAALDNEHTYTYERDTDLFAKRNEALETMARKEAEESLRRAAIEAGILMRAQTSVSRTVEALLRSVGFENVEVTVSND